MGVVDRQIIVNFTIKKFLQLPLEIQKRIHEELNSSNIFGRIIGEEALYILFLGNALELIHELGKVHKAEILALPSRVAEVDEILSLYFRENLKTTGKDDIPFQINPIP
ncbi:MAG: hypothetical protein WC528_03450 [Patescibacteria group bacterium]